MPLQELVFFFSSPPEVDVSRPLKTTEEDGSGVGEATKAYLLLSRFARAALLSRLKVVFTWKEEQSVARRLAEASSLHSRLAL